MSDNPRFDTSMLIGKRGKIDVLVKEPRRRARLVRKSPHSKGERFVRITV